MTEHLDLDLLSDVLVGEADASTTEHARQCPSCAASLAALEAAEVPVAAALAGLPDPPLPPGLDDRLAAALAVERARGQAPGTSPATSTVTPLRPRRSTVAPWAAGTAAAALVAVVAGGGLLLLHRSGGTSTTASTADRAAAPKAAGVGEEAFPQSSSGTDYRRDGKALAAALPSLLRGSPSLTTGATPNAATPNGAEADPLARLREPAALAGCLAALQDAGDPSLPLAVDYARFEGTPALVVLLRSTRPGKVDAFVVGPGCSQADAQVRQFSRLPAP